MKLENNNILFILVIIFIFVGLLIFNNSLERFSLGSSNRKLEIARKKLIKGNKLRRKDYKKIASVLKDGSNIPIKERKLRKIKGEKGLMRSLRRSVIGRGLGMDQENELGEEISQRKAEVKELRKSRYSDDVNTLKRALLLGKQARLINSVTRDSQYTDNSEGESFRRNQIKRKMNEILERQYPGSYGIMPVYTGMDDDIRLMRQQAEDEVGNVRQLADTIYEVDGMLSI
ncbi:MAG: hypothetical protein CMP61_11365 [Flavobacteriales bacterium]|nr:hypothetical protein [Flavobacteriales bacterium]|tara:strand:- start:51 stop:740 length:690 start_codon:yes stop_codon:yes gene_type:complete